MTAPAIPLGPFRLDRCIGRGGMAEVWSGVHAAQGVPVAVKVMTGGPAREASFRAAFGSEVQAVASLDHPGIVLVLDHGEIGAETEEASRGLLAAGSPMLAMELADRGTLSDLFPGPPSWHDLRHVLLTLLDALAHAHARGVVHRDLKPSNILVFGDGGGAPRLKLADFGLAQASELQTRDDSTEVICGTPTFMAPEQLRGHWRDYGPWTDLYGLGCLAWTLATGKGLFGNVSFIELIRLQLEEKPAQFRPLLPVPRGFEGWLRRLLEKEPLSRFVRAADAVQALLDLGEPVVSPPEAGPEPLSPRRPPPLPATWARRDPSPPSMKLVGAGLGLHGLRSIPLLGRRAERDALWRALAEVQATGEARLVLLHGVAGNGKTHLAEWIAQRAHEVGGAAVLRASHGPNPGAEYGLPRTMARHLRCIGLSHPEVLARTKTLMRLLNVVDPDEWSGLADLMAPGEVPRSAGERFGLLERYFRILARQRSVIALFDDVQWGAESIAFARHLLEKQSELPTPALFLLTVRDESLAERPVEAAALGELLALRRATALAVPPLSREDRAALTHRVLGLADDLADEVDARTGGNPLFAVQLVGDWVQRGVIEVGETGFVLRPGAEAWLPDDLHQVWADRVARLLEDLPEGSRQAIEIAAILSPFVERRPWEAACRAAGAPCPPQLLESLVASRMALRTEEGWTFVHAMLRESVERLAREAGRYAAHNRACAAMLAERAASGERGAAERSGRHLLLAGEREAALEPLLQGARERREMSDYPAALALLSRREEALQALRSPLADPRWGAGWVLRARVHLHQGALDEAFRWAERAAAAAGVVGWGSILSEALRLLGDAARRRGELDRAASLYERCIALPENQHGAAAGFWGLGDVARLRGRLAEAPGLFDRSRRLYEEIGDAHGVADHWIGLADVARQRGDLTAAGDLYGRARAQFEALGNRYGVARCLNSLGDVARLGGNLGGATTLYLRSHAMLDALRSAEEVVPRLNLALISLGEERFADAAPVFLESRELLEKMSWGGLLACVHTGSLACAAHDRAWAAWDDHFDRGSTMLRGSGLLDPDLAWAAELAAQVCEAAGDRARAGAARELAREQRAGLGR